MTSCCKPCDTQPRTELSIIPVSPGSSGHFFREEIMTQHIGVKLINAFPMTRQAYNDFRGWQLPADENGSDDGYLVEYLDGGKPNTDRFDGYVSWSPKEVFEKAYRPVSGLSFGIAIEALRQGKKLPALAGTVRGCGWHTLSRTLKQFTLAVHLAFAVASLSCRKVRRETRNALRNNCHISP